MGKNQTRQIDIHKKHEINTIALTKRKKKQIKKQVQARAKANKK